MFVRSGREAPSVVSTRVLRTHRKNSMENFRLQERVKTIDFESQHNYSQISDEIDGVRQNLVKIKGVKKNVGVSVERRRLLRDKGLRILPSSKQNGEDYFTVRTSEGKDVIISCADLCDGNAMRKRLSIYLTKSAVTSCLEDENSDSEEPIDSTSGEGRGRRKTITESVRSKEFRYRNISPPLRPGSRRNFKDVDDENSEKGESLLLKNISSMERKFGILRPQTAYSKRERPRSRTFPVNLEGDETVRTPHEKRSRKHSGAAESSRKKSRVNNSVESETSTGDESNEETTQSDSKIHQVCNDNTVIEETSLNSSVSRPRMGPRSMTTVVDSDRSCIYSTTVALRRMSLDADKPIQLPLTRAACAWAQPQTSPERRSNESKKSLVIVDKDHENMERKFSKLRKNQDVVSVDKEDENCKLSERKVSCLSWKDNVQTNVNSHIKKVSLSNDSPPLNEFYPNIRSRSHKGRTQSAARPRPSMARDYDFSCRKVSKIKGKRSSQDFVYDARPDKALSKGYVTMQMTIGNKQVKLHVSKFSTGECLDKDTFERARAQLAVKTSVGINWPLQGSKR